MDSLWRKMSRILSNRPGCEMSLRVEFYHGGLHWANTGAFARSEQTGKAGAKVNANLKNIYKYCAKA
jgi:hypothetical protein